VTVTVLTENFMVPLNFVSGSLVILIWTAIQAGSLRAALVLGIIHDAMHRPMLPVLHLDQSGDRPGLHLQDACCGELLGHGCDYDVQLTTSNWACR
jgi:hypothetical protein